MLRFPSAALLAALALTFSLPAAKGAPQLAAPVMAVPASMDVVTFEARTEAENHKLVVTSIPTMLRVDATDDGFSVIYNPATEDYTGLEHRNYTYWDFSWPQVRAAVENSKRYETRLQDLNNEGLNMDTPPDAGTNGAPGTAGTSGSGSAGADDSGYVWRATPERKRINGLDCVRWTGDTEDGGSITAWCSVVPLPKVVAAIDELRKINEPIALVPVRTLVPDVVFPVFDALAKGGVTPVLILWGSQREQNTFAFVKAETREGKLAAFTVPKLYMKTTLITMDGMMNQPVPAPQTGGPPKKTWQN